MLQREVRLLWLAGPLVILVACGDDPIDSNGAENTAGGPAGVGGAAGGTGGGIPQPMGGIGGLGTGGANPGTGGTAVGGAGSGGAATGGEAGEASGGDGAGGTAAGGAPPVAVNGTARNPIVSHIFTADPSAHVFEGRIYIYASHDLDDQDGYDMQDYHVFSSDDLVNWQDHGVALDAADMSWVSSLYAPDCVYSEATGDYYLYFPNSGNGIGVAVSDSPAGPFVDAIGSALVDRSTPGVEDVEWVFDPSCFIDDDGQAYLYFGGGMPDTGDNLRVIRLGSDMVSLADASATTIVAPDFFEAAFMHKQGGRYYLSYSTTFANHAAAIDYLVSDDPMTGFTYAGTILPNPPENNGDNNHHSIVEYAGGWYIFYHNRVLSNRDGLSNYQRSITLDYLSYDAAGNIVQVTPTMGAVEQLKCLDAFSRMEAETMAAQSGIEIEFADESGTRVGVNVGYIDDHDWIEYSQVDFGAGASSFHARVASSSSSGGTIQIYVDGCGSGTLLGSCAVSPTGGWQAWTDVQCPITTTTGVHDLCLQFAGTTGEPLLNLNYFHFE